MTPAEFKALVTLIGDDDPEVRDHVRQQVIDMGDEAIPFLEQALDDAAFDEPLQDELVGIIHQLQFELVKQRLTNWMLLGGDNLLEGMWIIATYQYPDLELNTITQVIDDLYYKAWIRMRDEMHPYDYVRILNEVVLEEFRLKGNVKNFHSPANSMINVVLERRMGNPISICVIYMAVAARLGLPIYGVNLPNIFITTWRDARMQFYVNAYNRGLILSRKDLESYITALKLDQLDVFFEPCTNLDIIKRVLRNLNAAFEQLGEADKCAEIATLMRVVE